MAICCRSNFTCIEQLLIINRIFQISLIDIGPPHARKALLYPIKKMNMRKIPILMIRALNLRSFCHYNLHRPIQEQWLEEHSTCLQHV